MIPLPSPASLVSALAELPRLGGVRPQDLVKLPDKGLAHAHWRIAGRGLVLRVARASGTDAGTELARQAAAFRRAAPSGHVPRLHGIVQPTRDLPSGALVIEAIEGTPPRLPQDLAAIATALAAIHALPLPTQAAPLPAPEDPLADLVATVDRNLADAALDPASAKAIAEERDWARGFLRAEARRLPPAPRTLTLVDTHPGNFLVRRDGRAVFLDLEKAAYGNAALDLAHASLAVSVAWDPDCAAPLGPDVVVAFHRHYFAAGGDRALCPWLLPCRRLVWLRTTAFYARARKAPEALAGLSPEMRRHAESCIAAQLTPAGIAASRAEWLAGRWIDSCS